MSGGSFNYAYSKHWNWDVTGYGDLLSQLLEMVGWLKEIDRPAVAKVVQAHHDSLKAHFDAAYKDCDEIADLLQAVEWYTSSDWGIESVDQTYAEFINKNSAAQSVD